MHINKSEKAAGMQGRKDLRSICRRSRLEDLTEQPKKARRHGPNKIKIIRYQQKNPKKPEIISGEPKGDLLKICAL